MVLNKKIWVVLLGLSLSACASNKPIGMAYSVGDPILYERPLYPYHSFGYAPNYWNSYTGRYVVTPYEYQLGTVPSYVLGN